jgi:haloacid dehalogenase-like hydrolase
LPVVVVSASVEQVGDLLEGEPEALRSLDHLQQGDRLRQVQPVPAQGALGLGQQPAPLVVPQRLGVDAGRRGRRTAGDRRPYRRPGRLGRSPGRSARDRLREEAAATVTAPTGLTGAAPILVTGDNPRAAARLAAEVGITDVRAGLLPQDKVTAVKELEQVGRKVLVVGDGVNDVPALAAAHTGIAMGRAGSDLALETADAVVVRDELATIPTVIGLSRQARRLVVQNLVIAAVFITGLVVWDLAGTCRCRSVSPAMKAPPSSSASTACACWPRPPGAAPAPATGPDPNTRSTTHARARGGCGSVDARAVARATMSRSVSAARVTQQVATLSPAGRAVTATRWCGGGQGR